MHLIANEEGIFDSLTLSQPPSEPERKGRFQRGSQQRFQR